MDILQTRVDVVRLIDEGTMSGLQWLVAITCGLTLFVDGYDMQVLPLAVPTIARAWSVDPSFFSLALSTVSIGLGVSGAFIAPLGDRLGRRFLVIIALLLVGLATLLTSTSSSATELVVWRFLTGIGLGIGIPNCNAWTSEYTPLRGRATLLVLMNAAIAIGASCAAYITPSVLDAWGWRGVFIVGGCFPIAIALLALVATPESLKFLMIRRPQDARIPRILGRLAPGLRDVTPVLPDTDAAHPRASIFELLTPRFRERTLMLWGVVLANLFAVWFLISWLPTLLGSAGWSASAAVRGAALIQVGGVLGGLALSWFVDRGRTLPSLRGAFVLASVCLGLFAVAPSGALWVLLLCLVGAGVNGVQLALNALSTAYYPPAIKATGMSWVGVVGQVGSAVAPLVGGRLIAAHVSATHILALLGLVPLLCALATLRMRREWQGD